MFPIPWNKAFRKKDGTVVNIADAMSGGGGGSDLPPHSSSDAGKVLTVADDGTLEWDESGSGGGNVYTALILPVIDPRTDDYRICTSQLPLKTAPNTNLGYTFTGSYNLNEVFLPESYEYMEFYGDLKASVVTALNLTLLAEELSSDGVTEITLDEPITSFDAILIQGCYDTTGVSNYDTTIVYSNPQLNTPYWFGMKDRNTSYSGTVSFSDATHGTISAARRLKIYGLNW